MLNALVNQAVVPTGFILVTAVPTVIRFGDELHARVRMRDASWRDVTMLDLKEYVTEELNPENKNGVDGAEVFVPSSLLSSGMCFVDTPGLGSVFTGNTATTQAFVPHIDAALVVVGADPPIAGEELALVEAVGKQVEDLILVINKADRTSDPERAAAAKFTREVLEKRLHRPMGEVLEVSAAERMENHGPLRDWERLLASLHHLVEDSGNNLVRAACDRGLQRLSEQLLAIIGEDRDALGRNEVERCDGDDLQQIDLRRVEERGMGAAGEQRHGPAVAAADTDPRTLEHERGVDQVNRIRPWPVAFGSLLNFHQSNWSSTAQ